MDPCNTKSNQKRQRQRENGNHSPPQRKSPRLLAKHGPPPIKITDLNDDCLEKIFDRLDLLSLFNVAVSNEWLRPAARIVYKRRIGTKVTHLIAVTGRTDVVDRGARIAVRGLKMCLQYLRCLGPSISDLCIGYGDLDSQRCEYIHQYVNKYCAENLEKLFFVNKPSGRIQCFVGPFINVRNVTVSFGNLGDQLPLFPQWFPNVQRLMLNSVRMDKCIVKMPFNDLHYLKIDNINKGFLRKYASHLVCASRQLSTLEIHTSDYPEMSIVTLLNMIKDNQSIRKLIVQMGRYSEIVNPLEMQQFVNEHPTVRKLDFQNYNFTADIVIGLIRQLNSLKKFRFQIINAAEYDRFVSELAGQWQTTLFADFYGHQIVTVDR